MGTKYYQVINCNDELPNYDELQQDTFFVIADGYGKMDTIPFDENITHWLKPLPEDVVVINKNEVERLKSLIEKVHYIYASDKNKWADFKQENNI